MNPYPLILPLLVWQGVAAGQKPVVKRPPLTKVMATVDGVSITAGEVEGFLWDWRANDVVTDLISHQQILAYAKKHNVSVTEADVQKSFDVELAKIRKSMPPDQDPDTAMRNAGVTKSRLYLLVRRNLLLDKLVAQDFKQENFVSVSTLIVKPRTDSATDVAEAIRKAGVAYDRAKKGDKWADIVNSATDDPNLQRNGGLLGWRQLSAFPVTVQQEIVTLKMNEVTKPVQTSFGIQMFLVQGLGKDLTGQALADLKKQYSDASKSLLLQQIRTSSKVTRNP